MSVENILNNPAAKAKKAELAKTFNAAIFAINALEIEGTDEWLKAIKVEYVKRRTELDNASVDLDADINVAPKTRAKRKSKGGEGTVAEVAVPAGEEPTRALTAKEKAALAKSQKEKKDDLD